MLRKGPWSRKTGKKTTLTGSPVKYDRAIQSNHPGRQLRPFGTIAPYCCRGIGTTNMMLVSVTERTEGNSAYANPWVLSRADPQPVHGASGYLRNIGGLIGVLLGLGLGNVVTMLYFIFRIDPVGLGSIWHGVLHPGGRIFRPVAGDQGSQAEPHRVPGILSKHPVIIRIESWYSESSDKKNIHSDRMELISSSAEHIRIES